MACDFVVASLLYLEAEGYGALHEVYLARVFVGGMECSPVDVEGLFHVEIVAIEVDVVADDIVVGAAFEVEEPALGVGGI